MSLSAQREALARLHDRYQEAERRYKARILDEFCETCGYRSWVTLPEWIGYLSNTPSHRGKPLRKN